MFMDPHYFIDTYAYALRESILLFFHWATKIIHTIDTLLPNWSKECAFLQKLNNSLILLKYSNTLPRKIWKIVYTKGDTLCATIRRVPLPFYLLPSLNDYWTERSNWIVKLFAFITNVLRSALWWKRDSKWNDNLLLSMWGILKAVRGGTRSWVLGHIDHLSTSDSAWAFCTSLSALNSRPNCSDRSTRLHVSLPRSSR